MIGDRIKSKRIELNMSQDELAEKLYVTRQTISNYELGKSQPSIDMLQSLSKIFNCDLIELIGEETRAIFVNKKLNIKHYLIIFIFLAIYVLSGFWESSIKQQMATNYDLYWPYMYVFYFKRTLFIMLFGSWIGYVSSLYFTNNGGHFASIKAKYLLMIKVLMFLMAMIQVFVLMYLWNIYRPSFLQSRHIVPILLWFTNNHLVMMLLYVIGSFILCINKNKNTSS